MTTLPPCPVRVQEQLVAILFGMLRLKNGHMVELYREEACTAVRAVVKQASQVPTEGAEVPEEWE